MKKNIFLILILINSISAFPQSLIIEGIVKDELGFLESATILVKHSSKGVVTDIDGKFTIETKLNDTLVVSYLGRVSKEIAVKNKEKLIIDLNEIHELETVLITAETLVKRVYCKPTCCLVSTQCGIEVKYTSEYKRGKNKQLRIYPNASKTGNFYVVLEKDFKETIFLVYDMSGRLIKSQQQYFNSDGSIDLSRAPVGMYLVKIINEGKLLATKKIIKG